MKILRLLPLALAALSLPACSETSSGGATGTAASSSTSGASTVPVTDAASAASTPSSGPPSTAVGTSVVATSPTTAAPAPTTAAPAPTCHAVGEFPANFYELDFSLRRGDCGPAVRTLQEWLREPYGFTISVDGQFGPATEAAVRDLEVRFFGSGDGILDRDTWTIMTGSDADFIEP